MSDIKIKILPENLANKIAAGEVVQRPESVVKELLENSIDAGANNIELIVKRAGKQLIQVFDDGEGMSPEDAVLCVQKHATSKISVYEDLEAIMTLGFRGEALSAISAVSQLEIRTERRKDEIGTLLRIDDGMNILKEKGSFPKGTSISVKNLFYNTPARRHFLKSDATELKHIIDIFNKIALSHADLSFRLFNDDELIYDYPAGDLENRIKQVFADNMLDALLPVEERTEFLDLYGYIGKPTLLKKGKGEQYLFLNNRFVISRQMSHAVFTGYENILEKGEYPFFVLFMDLDPKKIDINVHPSKLEIRFDDERDIYNFVLAVVRKSLGSYDLVPSMMFGAGGSSDTEKLRFNSFNKVDREDFSDRPAFPGKQDNRDRDETRNNSFTGYSPSSRGDYSDKALDLLFGSLPESLNKTGSEEITHPFEKGENMEVFHKISNSGNELKKSEESTFIIQLHNKYILSQIKTGLMIIDQHVAHERILYEKALQRFEADLPFSQQLLFPKTVELDPGKFAVIKEINSYLIKLGFEIKFFSKNTIVIEGVPDDILRGSEEHVLTEMVEEYVNNFRIKKMEQKESIAKSYSCHSAIKAGDKLSDKEMRLLIDQLFATSMPYVCPHGRPVLVKISLDEFDRRFGRT